MASRSRRLAAVLGAVLAFACGADPGVEGKGAQPSLLLIGLDGVDLRQVDRLDNAGRLPNLRALMERGASGPLETVHVASPIIWTSIATGVRPERHGILAFLTGEKRWQTGLPWAAQSADGKPSSAPLRLRPAFWNVLSHYGRSVGVLAWWATYPAETVNGYLVSPYLLFLPPDLQGRPSVAIDWSDDDRRRTYPPELGEELGPMMYQASDVDFSKLRRIVGPGPQTPYTRWALARDRSYFEAALHLLESRPVDCVAVYFQGVDVASHDFSHWVFGHNINQRRPPRRPAAAVRAAFSRVEAMYEHVDEMVGELVAAVPSGTDVIVVSDHGWEYDETSHWNLDPGTFIAAGPSYRKAGRIEGMSVLDIAPLMLATLDVPVARALDGDIPPGVMTAEAEERVRSVDDYPIPAVALEAGTPGEAPEDEEMKKLLRGLGYVE